MNSYKNLKLTFYDKKDQYYFTLVVEYFDLAYDGNCAFQHFIRNYYQQMTN